MTLKTIRLELARNPDFPEGSAAHGYDLKAPLDAEGHLDAEAWRRQRAECRVRRFWAGEGDRNGELIHTRQGWALSYEPGDADDEAIYKLDRHLFRTGEYVTITEPDGDSHTFRIASVK